MKKKYKVHWGLPAALGLGAVLGLGFGVHAWLSYTGTREEQLLLALCFLGAPYVLYKAYSFWSTPIIIDESSISFRGVTIPFSTITRFPKQDPFVVKLWWRHVLYEHSVWYTVESPQCSITFISGMFPQHEQIASEVVKGSGVALEALDKFGNKKEASF